ncbi:SIR2 family protein [Escherichia coli]|uniref:SIR2 family protein n=1 Tax=Escherichia coli TaxID=562 RepID=UPI000D01EB71|nr:SIR2 family protein [Escherichia coli]
MLNQQAGGYMGVLFLFGAGASYGSGPCKPTNPPLGRDLLLKMREEGGIASTIEGDLLNCFIDDPEKGMIRFFEERNSDTTELLKQMCSYLANFTIDEGNTYIKLFKMLKKRKSICVATTNYDLLIEQAISSVGHLIQYYSSERIPKNIPVLKIHGSVNFIPRANIFNLRFEIPNDKSYAIFEGPIDIYDNAEKIINYCKSNTALSPAVAMYHPNKTVLHCPSFIANQQKDFQTEISKSSKIFIIGLKINPDDKHIWSEIENTKADVYIVDRDKEATASWISRIHKKNIYHIADTFDGSVMRIKSILQL